MVNFSIIIPVYNVQEYLARCVESVVNQTYPQDHLQVILVNDGSKDNSGAMCDKFAAEYSFVEAYHKENGGLSDARNYGMERAKGEYVIFLDSDDYLSADACARFAEEIAAQPEQLDVVAAAMVKHIGDGESLVGRVPAEQPLMTGEAFLEKELRHGKFCVAACSYVFRRSLLEDNAISFWKGLLHEDEDFTPRALLAAKTVLSTNIGFYHYVIRENSITTKKDRTPNAICFFKISKKLTPIFDALPNLSLRALLKTHLAKIMYKAICDAELFSKEKRQIIDYKLLKENSIFTSEKVRYYITRISPKLLYRITTLRRR